MGLPPGGDAPGSMTPASLASEGLAGPDGSASIDGTATADRSVAAGTGGAETAAAAGGGAAVAGSAAVVGNAVAAEGAVAAESAAVAEAAVGAVVAEPTGGAVVAAGSDRPAALPRPVVPRARASTGDLRVDDAVARLDDLAGLPVAEHLAVFEYVHERLTDALGDLDVHAAARAGDRSPGAPGG